MSEQKPKPYAPRPGRYAPLPDGTWLKPVSDDYWTLITKVYQPDYIPPHTRDMGRVQIPGQPQAAIGAKTWFYENGSLHGAPEIHDGVLKLTKHMPDGRHQESYIPLTEIIRVDYNSPSQAFMDAEDAWSMQEFGMSAEEVEQMRKSSQHEMLKENIRQELAQTSGLSPNRIHVIDNGDGTFTAAVKPEENDGA